MKISVLPTLLVTALSYHPDVRKALKPHAKAGEHLYLLGQELEGPYFGTTVPKYFEITSAKNIGFDLVKTRTLYQNFHEAFKKDLIASAHDVSEGGILFAVFEALMLNGCGISLPEKKDAVSFYLGEAPGRMIVSVSSEKIAAFEATFPTAQKLGTVNGEGSISIVKEGARESLSVAKLAQEWRAGV